MRVIQYSTLLLLLVFAIPLQAQQNSGHGHPKLNDHVFVDNVVAPSPLVRSFIRNKIGVGQTSNLTTPIYEIDGNPVGGFQGNLFVALLDLEYQYAIKPWIALRTRMLASFRQGSDTISLLSDGITVATGFEISWLIRLYEGDRTAWSLDAGLSDRSFTGINLSRFVEDIIVGDPATLVRKTPTARTNIGLRFAWAASSLVGVTANTRTGFGESANRTQGSSWFFSFASAIDFDLRTKTSAPIGLAFGYSYDSFPETGDDFANGINGTFIRVSYFGRDDFLLSLDFSYERIPGRDQRPDVDLTALSISFRYYF